MAKESMKAREIKRAKIVKKYESRRKALKEKKELKEFFEGFMKTKINFEKNAEKRLTKVVE